MAEAALRRHSLLHTFRATLLVAWNPGSMAARRRRHSTLHAPSKARFIGLGLVAPRTQHPAPSSSLSKPRRRLQKTSTFRHD